MEEEHLPVNITIIHSPITGEMYYEALMEWQLKNPYCETIGNIFPHLNFEHIDHEVIPISPSENLLTDFGLIIKHFEIDSTWYRRILSVEEAYTTEVMKSAIHNGTVFKSECYINYFLLDRLLEDFLQIEVLKYNTNDHNFTTRILDSELAIRLIHMMTPGSDVFITSCEDYSKISFSILSTLLTWCLDFGMIYSEVLNEIFNIPYMLDIIRYISTYILGLRFIVNSCLNTFRDSDNMVAMIDHDVEIICKKIDRTQTNEWLFSSVSFGCVIEVRILPRDENSDEVNWNFNIDINNYSEKLFDLLKEDIIQNDGCPEEDYE